MPDRWVACPPHCQALLSVGGSRRFAAFKTPLSATFDAELPDPATRWGLSTAAAAIPGLGLVVDLTKTARYYSAEEARGRHKLEYTKLECDGHDGPPSPEQVRRFIELCRGYWDRHPGRVIGVHCTHGFNRTGFLIIACLVVVTRISLAAAITEFARVRQGGIYKQTYLSELHRRYDPSRRRSRRLSGSGLEEQTALSAVAAVPTVPNRDGAAKPGPVRRQSRRLSVGPDAVVTTAVATAQERAADALPEWCSPAQLATTATPSVVPSSSSNAAEGSETDTASGTGIFVITGIEPALPPWQGRLRRRCRELLGGRRGDFPGPQPRNLERNTMHLIQRDAYKVSWKADGTRYLLLTDGGTTHMIGRDNCVFKVPYLIFPRGEGEPRSGFREIGTTLIDGELVRDQRPCTPAISQWNFYAFDCFHCDGNDLRRCNYDTRRRALIDRVIQPRELWAAKHQARGGSAMVNPPDDPGSWAKSGCPPFAVLLKAFWDVSPVGSADSGLNIVNKLLAERRFSDGAPLCHEDDGLIFVRNVVGQAGDQQVYPGAPNRGAAYGALLKWKPPELNTVDFLFRVVRSITDDHEERSPLAVTAFLYVRKNGVLVEFVPCIAGFEGIEGRNARLAVVSDQAATFDGQIVECWWDREQKTWKPLRIRTDKAHPNGLTTALRIFASILQPVTKDMLRRLKTPRPAKRPRW